ncbi:hypothetical protein C3K47_15740 [Solitalea longa]|uniref:Lipocalin-like domain-containing protein n=1 Tax=Solitalea longa TaxID=2079460 RepID=A0A2S4ZY42_9SPHI|nr:lipocalin family protein [Solitalea longa]POY35235.1 hypothetical protein C3K47_15740 [Solitalea longa]
MTKNLLSFKLSSLVFLFTFLLPIACKKGDSDPEIPKENILVLDKTTVTPGDLVTVNYELPKDKSSWEILIGAKNVTLTKIDDTTAAFLVPVIPSGQLNLDFSIVGAKEKPDLTISAYSPISNPEQVKDAYLAELDNAIADVSSIEDANTLTVFKETFKAKYAALTDTEKKELAFVLQKLKFDMPDIAEQAIHSKSTNDLIDVPSRIDTDQEYRAGVIGYVALVTESIALLTVSAEAIAAPTGFTQALGLAGLAATFYTFKKALDYKRVLFLYNGQNKEVINLKILLSGQNNSTKVVEAVTTADPEIVFETGVQRSFNVSSAYQGVSIADEKSTNAFFRKIVLVTNKATSIYNGVVKVVNKVKSWFSGDPKLIELASGIPATPASEIRNSPANLIKIENVSNSAIKLSTTANGDILTITATGTIKEDQTFTFDVVYSYPAMGISKRKKITAKLNNPSLNGTWKLISEVDESNQTDIITPCSGNNTLSFNSSKNTYVGKSHKPFNGACQLESEYSGTYTLNNGTLNLSVNVIGSPQSAQVILLSGTTLKLRFTDNHGSYLETYTRQ